MDAPFRTHHPSGPQQGLDPMDFFMKTYPDPKPANDDYEKCFGFDSDESILSALHDITNMSAEEFLYDVTAHTNHHSGIDASFQSRAMSPRANSVLLPTDYLHVDPVEPRVIVSGTKRALGSDGYVHSNDKRPRIQADSPVYVPTFNARGPDPSAQQLFLPAQMPSSVKTEPLWLPPKPAVLVPHNPNSPVPSAALNHATVNPKKRRKGTQRPGTASSSPVHGYSRKCAKEDCPKVARGTTPFCVGHGGGPRCQHEGCTKGAVGATSRCIGHGGGRRCQHLGCVKAARGGFNFCVAHGGGRRCTIEGCRKSAIGPQRLCISHGGVAMPRKRTKSVQPATSEHMQMSHDALLPVQST